MSSRHAAFLRRLQACDDPALLAELQANRALWAGMQQNPPLCTPLTRGAMQTRVRPAIPALPQVRKLLALGCDLEVIDSETGHTALSLAVVHADIERLQLLLAAGADPNGQYRDGNQRVPVLMAAAVHPNAEAAKHLIDAGADTAGHALQYAFECAAFASYADPAWVEPLAAVHVAQPVWRRLLWRAITEGDADCVKGVLAHLDDVNAEHRGVTPLGWALERVHDQHLTTTSNAIVEALLAAGADPNIPVNGRPPLEIVLSTSPEQHVQRHRLLSALLCAGARLDVPASNGALVAELPPVDPEPEMMAVWTSALARHTLRALDAAPDAARHAR